MKAEAMQVNMGAVLGLEEEEWMTMTTMTLERWVGEVIVEATIGPATITKDDHYYDDN